MLPNCFPGKKGTAVVRVPLKIIMKISGGGGTLQLSIQKFLNFIKLVIFLCCGAIIVYIYMILFSFFPFNFEFQWQMSLLSYCHWTFKKCLWKENANSAYSMNQRKMPTYRQLQQFTELHLAMTNDLEVEQCYAAI